MKARCFDSEEDADKAILEGGIQEGQVVVIRYEGPKGGPGMRGNVQGHEVAVRSRIGAEKPR